MSATSHDLKEMFGKHFATKPTICSRAPGRIEFIGNHTDYNGGEVMGAAVDLDLRVAFAPRSDQRIRLVRADTGERVEYDEEKISGTKVTGWTAYPMGVREVLIRQGHAERTGFDFLVQSDLPSGSGLSSSAAFELASSLVFESTTAGGMDMLTRVRACRQAENDYVGVPCGILDQAVSGFGRQGCLVHIDCRTESIETVTGLENTRLWVFQSGTKHSLVESMYSTRHKECGEALHIFAQIDPSCKELVDVSPELLNDRKETMDPTLWKRAYHVVHEHLRVGRMREALQKKDPVAAGQLLKDSHDSSSRYFENSIPELDTLVNLLCQEKGVYGARLTGGGFGGAVMALASLAFSDREARKIAVAYEEKHGLECQFFATETTDGASLLDCSKD